MNKTTESKLIQPVINSHPFIKMELQYIFSLHFVAVISSKTYFMHASCKRSTLYREYFDSVNIDSIS